MPAPTTHDHGQDHSHLHGHHHHHAPGQRHPPATVGSSLLRMTVGARLSVAAVLIALIWAVVIWAMS
jgi:hypothetical protein